VKRPATTEPDSPVLQRLIEEARASRPRGLLAGKRGTELVATAAFLAVAVPMATLLDSPRSLDWGLAIGLVVSYAIAARVRFHTGSCWTVPTELIFVPMLFLLPTPAVPLFVSAALVLGRTPEYLSRAVHPSRTLMMVGDGWYAVGPALVLTLAGADTPSWGDWPIYLGALGAQFGLDLVWSVIRIGIGLGERLRTLLGELRAIDTVDALLAPVGLLAAFASVDQHWAFLLTVPLIGLIAIFARERETRIKNALTLSQAHRGTAHLLGELLTTTHEYTGTHSRSVVVLAHHLGLVMDLDEDVQREIEFGALLHDIGKMAVPSEIINKPGALTDEEMALMRTHTEEGEQMLARIGGALAEVGHVVRSHHEHWDGNGYPDGLREEQIPIAARVISCCDAFNAMTTHRPYRDAMPPAAALTELRTHSGTQFDPDVVRALIGLIEGGAPGAPFAGRPHERSEDASPDRGAGYLLASSSSYSRNDSEVAPARL
jgi:putative nucleotidyltransferase with HDIG domain